MILISHRGNISGADASLENHPDYIREVLRMGYDCEIDVWYQNDEWWLGHDHPVYDVSKSFLRNNRLWCHAKNLEALDEMLKEHIHCFWHENDTMTLTSKNYIWMHSGECPIKNSIAVLPEIQKHKINTCKGICSDYIQNYI